ncbi:hypothetical protein HNY73_011190 [Argiope bruennichi]|uniref:Uncharacterized protein n=1 Tax=Argiope bruennichi TaxID=94029 RepID=A0A8T0F5Y5_ARGBR|nr:hypothetical protein HNY73_011190 [Argiope bruennichi]
MPYKCSVPACRGNYEENTVAVFGYPIDEALREKRLPAIPRKMFTITKNSRGLPEIGLKVMGIVTDNNSINRAAATSLTNPPKLQIKYNHPVDNSHVCEDGHEKLPLLVLILSILRRRLTTFACPHVEEDLPYTFDDTLFALASHMPEAPSPFSYTLKWDVTPENLQYVLRNATLCDKHFSGSYFTSTLRRCVTIFVCPHVEEDLPYTIDGILSAQALHMPEAHSSFSYS